MAIMPSMRVGLAGPIINSCKAVALGEQVRVVTVKSEYAHDRHGELSVRLVLDDWKRAWVVVVLAEVEQAD